MWEEVGEREKSKTAGQPPPKFQRQVPGSRNQNTVILTIPGPANFNCSSPNAVILHHFLPHSPRSLSIPLSIKETTGFSSLKSVSLLYSTLTPWHWVNHQVPATLTLPLLKPASVWVTALTSHIDSSHHLPLPWITPLSNPFFTQQPRGPLFKTQHLSPECIYTQSSYSHLFVPSSCFFPEPIWCLISYHSVAPLQHSKYTSDFRMTDKTLQD